jgi:hypothetical protein
MSRIRLQQISNVSLSNVQNGDVLKYNSSTSKFENGVVSGGGSSEGRIVNNIISTGFPYTISSPASTVTSLKYLIDNGSSDVGVTLPTAASPNTDLRIEIKRRGTGTVTVTPSGGQLIDGLSSLLISSQYATLTVDSDGTGWNIK